MGDNAGTIVVIEDDAHIADLVDLYLRREGWRVLSAPDADRGLELVRQSQPRLLILDIGLPGSKDGFDVCRAVRAESDLPLLFLTARDDEIDRVLGLELGADDYLTKPFSPRELVARVKAVLRRAGAAVVAPQTIDLGGGIELDAGRREVHSGGDLVQLTTREFDLLSLLASHLGLVLSRQQLLDGAWGPGWIGDERTVDVHIAQLRKKLGPSLDLITLRGVGYRLG
ncbi:MAG TPA: response regulator transcription factor [Acidimicrobiales bacterium]|nr:response regulator transcription factor [Acidimicrobiales bacterium]